eukprot:7602864-Pyramimonas_sp.AAC.1
MLCWRLCRPRRIRLWIRGASARSAATRSGRWSARLPQATRWKTFARGAGCQGMPYFTVFGERSSCDNLRKELVPLRVLEHAGKPGPTALERLQLETGLLPTLESGGRARLARTRRVRH